MGRGAGSAKLGEVIRDRRALVLRLVAAELLARRGEGPLARRRPLRIKAAPPKPPMPEPER